MIDPIFVLVFLLLAVAYSTTTERNVLASIQRRVGPNAVGVFGVLQPFADALKLLTKEYVVPSQASTGLFFLAPVITLVFALLGWAVIPFGPGLALANIELGVLYSLAISSIGVYGILLAGWSANSKWAFLGGLRSTAQIVSYELVLSSCVLIVVILIGSFSYSVITEAQASIWNIVPLLPVAIIYLISVLAETSRTPFDLPEAESELVAGYFTEHSAAPFVLILPR